MRATVRPVQRPLRNDRSVIPSADAAASVWHRRVWALSWPVIVSNVTVPLVGLVDTAVVGRLPEARYIGAVALAATAFSFMYWGFGFLRMGTTGIVAQAYGGHRHEELAASALRGFGVALLLGALLLMLQAPIQALVFWVYPASAAVETLARAYFDVRIWGAPATLVYFICMGVLFGLQRMRATLVLLMVMNVVNMLLDVLFVLVFDWGVPGVAAASVISEWLGALTGVLLVSAALRALGARWPSRSMLLEAAALARFFGVSTNIMLRSLCLQVVLFSFAALGARQGDVVLAANAVLMQFVSVLAFGLDGVAHAAEALAGAAWGARDRVVLARAVRFTLLWAGLFALVFALFFGVAGNLLVALLTDIEPVRLAAADYLGWVVVMSLVGVWAYQYDGIYIGTTRTREMRNYMVVALLVFVLAAWLLIPRFGNHGLWLAYTLFLASRGLTLALAWPRLAARLPQGSPA